MVWSEVCCVGWGVLRWLRCVLSVGLGVSMTTTTRLLQKAPLEAVWLKNGKGQKPHPHWTRREKRSKLGPANPVVATVLFTLHAKQQATQHHTHKWNLAPFTCVASNVDGAKMFSFFSFSLNEAENSVFHWFPTEKEVKVFLKILVPRPLKKKMSYFAVLLLCLFVEMSTRKELNCSWNIF